MPARRKDLKIEGPNLWYLVGLITSDGCLSSDGRHIDITSKDRDFLIKIRDALGVNNRIGLKYGANHCCAFHFQIGNKNFYEFLLSIGLTPNKSLTLEALNIPQEYFTDFLRGLIDGDGCIRKWRHPSNNREQWSLRIYSGSGEFLSWLQNTIALLLKIKGKAHKQSGALWILKYGKMATRIIA